MPVRRTRLIACCALLIALALIQDPGLLVADTKFDLVEAPLDWLSRSLHMWDAEGGFGQVQNQAHGYLWPMGPFFVLFDAVGLPGWVIQRLWQALVMCVALTGMAKLSRAFGVRSDLACLVAGFAFALSPRLLTSLGPISIEVWPSALAPWVLLPLVHGARTGSARRAAALSALAVAMVGGVNAAASFAVVPLAVVWILTRTPGPRRRALLLWWPIFAALATAWWIVPLLVMGPYSPPFLDFTETSAVTTFPTTLFDTLRGTSHWVPYVDTGSRAGGELIGTPWLALNTAVVVVVGLVGLLDRRTPHRTFLVLGLSAGVLMVTAGHHGAVEGWFAGAIAEQLDGVLAPLRNVHKFDPVLRIPLLIGVASVVDRAVSAVRAAPGEGLGQGARRGDRINAGVLVSAVVLAVVGSAAPALATRVEPAGGMLGIPAYWQEAADYVADRSEGTALLVPGSAFAEYLWGDPNDEPFQWLADSRWAVRHAGILAEPGQIRMLDGLERRFAEGNGSAGLTEALRRAGVAHLVVRNDLRGAQEPSPALVHRAISESPGLVRVASFGPDLGGDAVWHDGDRRTLVDGGRQATYPAIEIFRVPGVAPAVAATAPTVVAGGPDDLADLIDAGIVGQAPVRFAADLDPTEESPRPRRVVLTDGLRARDQNYARMQDGASATLTPGEVGRSSRPNQERWSSTARLVGVREISASSSGSDATAPGGSNRGQLPYAALDHDDETAWVSAGTESAPWWQADLVAARRIPQVTVHADTGVGVQRLRVVTAAGATPFVELSPGGTRQLTVPAAESTTWIRVEGGSGVRLALTEVSTPGLEAERILDLPELPVSWGTPDAVALRADRDGRTGCVQVAAVARCAEGTERTGEEGAVLRRSVPLPAARSYTVDATAVPRGGAALDALALRGQPVSVEASSTAVRDPRAGAVAAIDGNADTAWLAAPDDDRTSLHLSWLGRHRIDAIRIEVDDATAARRPTEVVLRFWRGTRRIERRVSLDEQGRARFAAVRADRVEVDVAAAQTPEQVTDVRRDGAYVPVPVGIGEITLSGVPFLPLSLPTTPTELPCGTGPDVIVGTRTWSTSLTASPADLLDTDALPVRLCGAEKVVTPAPGALDVTAEPSGTFLIDTIALTATDDPGELAMRPLGLEAEGVVARRIEGPHAGETVAVPESANRGWVGTQDGDSLDSLDSVVLDGWQQGFVSTGRTPIEMRFAPDNAYQLGLLAGLIGLLGLVGGLALGHWRLRPDARPAVTDRRLSVVAAVLLSLLLGGLLAGTPGLGIAGAVVVIVGAARRSTRLAGRGEVLRWLLAAPVVVVGLGYMLQPWGDPSGWAGQITWLGYLCVVPLVALPVAAASVRGGRRRPQRMTGSSTRR